jgi:FMN reductase [NAD(P)H]
MPEENPTPSHHGVDASTDVTPANETLRLLIERSSCRSFHDRKIPEGILDQIFEAGIRSATGGNLQPYSIIRIDDADTKKKLATFCGEQDFIATAPTDLLFCIDWRRLERWAALETAPFTATSAFRHFWISFQDAVIAAQSICTAADALGLGSVYVGTVLECFPELREMFALPNGVFPVVLLALGYPKARPLPKKKLGAKTVVHREKYREMSDQELLAAYAEKYPGWRKEITPERMETIAEVCRSVHGEEFAEKCHAAIARQGYVNAIQNYFGLHYRADWLPDRNEDFLKIMEEFGFSWFQPFRPAGSGS